MASTARTVASDPQRILVRGVNWLGDAVMTTPALVRLRERFPDAEITLLTHEKLRELWSGHPAVDRVLTFRGGEGVWSLARRLRVERFELALVLPNSPRSALECLLARVPRRVGGAWPWRSWLLTDAVPPAAGITKMRKRTPDEVRRLVAAGTDATPEPISPQSHQLHHYLRLVAHLGGNPQPVGPCLSVRLEESSLAVEEWRQKQGADRAQPLWLGLNVGAEYGPAKRWPLKSWIAAANQVSQRLEAQGRASGWLLFGVAKDAELVGQVARSLVAPSVNLCGRTTLRQLMAELARCRVVLTNDTGPMHVAAALGVPVVVPFGSTSPELTGPGLPGDPRNQLLRGRAACAPCFLRECPVDFRCMNTIPVEQVVQATLQALDFTG